MPEILILEAGTESALGHAYTSTTVSFHPLASIVYQIIEIYDGRTGIYTMVLKGYRGPSKDAILPHVCRFQVLVLHGKKVHINPLGIH
jgi:hypothetical protein